MSQKLRGWPLSLSAFLRLHGFAPFALALVLLATAGCSGKHVLAPEPLVNGTDVSAIAMDANAQATCARPSDGRAQHLEGDSQSGALWVLDKPAQWNGDLVVYMHGYTNPAQPVALPDNAAIRDGLLARGFAVAASSYSSNGYAVREGVKETRQLSEIFARRVGRPRHTYLFGQSLGGLIGLILSQECPEQYDGSMLVCGIVGGSDEEVQYIGDIRVLFDVAYPGVLPGDLEHTPAITDLNAQVVNPVVQAVTAHPEGLGIIQMLARRPLPGATNQEVVASLVNVLGFAMQGGSDLFARTHQHSFFDNARWRYTSPGLPPAVTDDVNARVARYTISADAAAFLARFGEPSGRLRIPVLSLHTSRDPVVPAFHEDLFAQVDRGPWLVQHQIDRYGHCTFTVDELMSSFEELVAWAGSRQRPVS